MIYALPLLKKEKKRPREEIEFAEHINERKKPVSCVRVEV
jgi:hypothetical protein